jgi:hypothetical protein
MGKLEIVSWSLTLISRSAHTSIFETEATSIDYEKRDVHISDDTEIKKPH